MGCSRLTRTFVHADPEGFTGLDEYDGTQHVRSLGNCSRDIYSKEWAFRNVRYGREVDV